MTADRLPSDPARSRVEICVPLRVVVLVCGGILAMLVPGGSLAEGHPGGPSQPALAIETSPPTARIAGRQATGLVEEIDALVQRSFAAPRDSVAAYCRRAEGLLLAAGGERASDVRLLARLALVNGRLAEFEGNTQKVERVRRVEACCRLAIARDSTAALPYILLGALHYRLSHMSWLERTLARTFIGELPRTSLAEAERLLRRGISLQGGSPCSHYALGCTLAALDREDEAEAALRLALCAASPGLSPLDAHYLQKARERLFELEQTRPSAPKSWQEPGEGT